MSESLVNLASEVARRTLALDEIEVFVYRMFTQKRVHLAYLAENPEEPQQQGKLDAETAFMAGIILEEIRSIRNKWQVLALPRGVSR